MRTNTVTLLGLALCLFGPLSAKLNFPDKHPLDKSEYRRLTLDNGLKVLLLSDSKLNVSSASMCVAVGAMSDPDERSGLAHFLEHMLFLGTKKFPEAGEYGKYLQTNGGYSNAYTSSDHTNYHFQVYHDAFEGALDRFSQFFIAPLFTEEFTKREMNAVNSEHQKNLQNDTWRQLQIRRTLYNPKHPSNNFSTGSLETLDGIKRSEFMDFYKAHYSANQMTLAICGKAGLDQLEAWARQYFTTIENRDRPEVTFSADYLLPRKAFRLVRIEPVKDIRTLTLEFPTPPGDLHYESKPADLLGFIIGHEGKGSLLSYLKEMGLATALGAYGFDPGRQYGSFFIRIQLTPKGLKQYRDVVSHVFSYIQVLKDAAYPSALFREQVIMAKLEELYSDKGEGTGRATSLANNLRLYPLEIAERIPYLWTREEPDVYRKFVTSLRPDNFLCILAAKGVKTDSVEKYYGTKYSMENVNDKVYKALWHPRKIPGLHLPEPNPYLPDTLQQLAERPVKLIDDNGLTLYYSQDTQFQRPKVTITFHIRQSAKGTNLRNTVIRGLYADCVNEALNEEAYPAAMAGLSYGVGAGINGVNLTVSGYSRSAVKLLGKVVETMKDFDVSEERFASLKDRTIRGLENFPKSDAWRIARLRKNQLQEKVFFTPEEQLPVVREITLKDIQNHLRKELFRQCKVEALIHGNLTAANAIASARMVERKLGTRPISGGEPHEKKLLVQKPGETILRTGKLEVNNSAFWREYDIAQDQPLMRAATLVIDNFVSQPFYNEMRTKQQLGYIVWGGASRKEKRLQAYFIIQSASHPADELQRRADAFLKTLPGKFEALPDSGFERLKSAAREKVKEQPKSIGEKAGILFSRAYDHDGDFNREQATLEAIDDLTKAEAVEVFQAMFGEETRRQRTFLYFAREHEAKEKVEQSFDDLGKWKAGRQFR